MNRFLFLLFCIYSCIDIEAQKVFIPNEDSTFNVEFKNGDEWVYIEKDNFIVGMNNKRVKDGYGTNYQIQILIQNLSESPYLFDPTKITASILKKDNFEYPLLAYTNEAYQKKIKKLQTLTMLAIGVANGINIGTSSYRTTYVTQSVNNCTYTQPVMTYDYAAASAAQIASNTQLMIMGNQMEEDRKIREEGYLQKTTIHSGEGIVGYINIKMVKGLKMSVSIPINGKYYTFYWNVEKQNLTK